MSFLLQLVDDTDAILFDFNDSTGANNPNGLKTFCFDVDLGVPGGSPSFFESDSHPGGSLIHQRDELVQMSWRQGLIHPGTVDQFRSGIGNLLSDMRSGGILKFRPATGAEVRYIDFISAQVGAMLRGQNLGIVRLFQQLLDPDGLPIAVIRQPYLRGAEVTSAATAMSNDTSGYIYRALDEGYREVSNGWGSADIGGAWTITTGSPASDFSVTKSPTDSAWGLRHRQATTNITKESVLTSVSVADLDAIFDARAAGVAPSGATHEQFFVFRRTDANNYYRVRILSPISSGNVQVSLEKVVGGTVTEIVAPQTSAVTSAAGVYVRTRVYASGTTLRVKVWRTGAQVGGVITESEPASWLIDTTDASITSAGAVGFRSFLPSGATGTPVVMHYRNLAVREPTATRSGRYMNLAVTTEAPVPVKIKAKSLSGSQQSIVVATGEGSPSSSRIIQPTSASAYQSGATSVTNATTEASDRSVLYWSDSSATKSQWKRVARNVITSGLADYHGDWDVLLRARLHVASTGSTTVVPKVALQLRWGPYDADPGPYIESEVILDSSMFTQAQWSFAWHELNLGRLRIPETASALTLELWGRVIAGDATSGLEADAYMLVPTETQTIISVPATGQISTLGDRLTNSGGTLDGTTVVLDGSTDYAEMALGVLPAGRWRISTRYSTQAATGTPQFQFRTSTTVHSSVNLSIGDREGYQVTVEWDTDGTSTYLGRVTGPTAGTVHVHEITLSRIETLQTNQSLASDPTDPGDLVVEKRDSADRHLLYGQTAGPVPVVVDGSKLLYVSSLAPRRDGVTPALESFIEGAVEIIYTYAPRYYG